MKSILLSSTFVFSLGVMTADAATVDADFAVTNQSLFGSGGAAAFNGSVGVGSNSSTFQFKASTGASTGTVSSQASFKIDADFAAAQEIGLGNVKLSFGGGAASFDTALGAFIDVNATVRTPKISVPFAPDIPAASIPFSLIDEDYQLNAAKADSTYFFGQTLSDKDSVSLPGAGVGVGITLEANPNVDQTSMLTIAGLSGTLVATNQSTGTTVSEMFLFNGGMEGFDLDFSEAGIWDLALKNLSLNNMFDSDFGLSATFSGGAEIGLGCGNPATDEDNGFACLFDAGISRTTSTVNLLNTGAFALNYNTIASLDLGSVTVNTPVSPVPIPASLPLLAGALGAFGWVGHRRRQGVKALQTNS